jgi:spermidine synthase
VKRNGIYLKRSGERRGELWTERHSKPKADRRGEPEGARGGEPEAEQPGERTRETYSMRAGRHTEAGQDRSGAGSNQSRSYRDRSHDAAVQRTAISRARLVKMVYAGGALLGFSADLAVAPGASVPAGKPEAKAGRATLVHQQKGMFGLMVVTEEDNGLRTLRFGLGGPRQSVVRPGYPRELALRYTRAAMVGLALVAAPQRVLVVGLGGGSLPMFLRSVFPLVQIDAVDIDPAVIEVARRFLGFREDPLLRSHAVDGRRFVETAPAASYDLIFLDAYSAEAVPLHLATREFLLAVLRAMHPEGLVVSNLWGPSMNPLFGPMLRTYHEVFADLYVVELAGVENRIVLASARSLGLHPAIFSRLAAETSLRLGLPFDLGVIVEEGLRRPVWTSAQDAVLRD